MSGADGGLLIDFAKESDTDALDVWGDVEELVGKKENQD